MILPRIRWILLFLLIFATAGNMHAQESRKVKNAKKEAEKAKAEKIEMALLARNDRIERHFNMQSKEVQKRLKKSARKTERHYKKVNRKKFLLSIFSKPRKRYGR